MRILKINVSFSLRSLKPRHIACLALYCSLITPYVAKSPRTFAYLGDKIKLHNDDKLEATQLQAELQKRRIASSEENSRKVRAEKDVGYDLTNSEGIQLLVRMKYRFFESAQIVSEEDGRRGLIFGNMKFHNFSGQEKDFCGEFKKLQFVFSAQDTIVSGENPRMILRIDCKSESEHAHLDPIWFSNKGLKKADSNAFENGELRFENVEPDEQDLPQVWGLEEVKFFSNDPEDYFVTKGHEIAAIRNGKAFQINLEEDLLKDDE